VTDPTQAEIVSYCQNYQSYTTKLDNLIGENIAWEDYFDYNLNSANKTKLELKDGNAAAFETVFKDLASKLRLAPYSGAYVIKNNDLYLYKAYQYGRDLNIANTINNINAWLADPKSRTEILSFDQTEPDILTAGYNIIDLTNNIAEGTSRLDLVRDGVTNVRVHNSQIALEALDLFILQPGQEFSFYQDTGIASHKIYGALGVCNASTTMFRLALMAGFPITDRSPHTSYIQSYEYPAYPINNVEATFYGGPIVDLKFVNNLNYPVLLKVTIDRSANDGYQYHTVTAYTSPNVTQRYVELTDFKKWDVISDHRFKSSFTRKIWQDATKTTLLSEDTFSANYY
jgi:vancomycin resistance protein YoaR